MSSQPKENTLFRQWNGPLTQDLMLHQGASQSGEHGLLGRVRR